MWNFGIKGLTIVLIIAVSVYLISAKTAQAASFLQIIAGVFTVVLFVALTALTGGLGGAVACALSCGVVGGFASGAIGTGIVGATTAGAAACASGLICSSSGTQPVVVYAPQSSATCSYQVNVAFYNTDPKFSEDEFANVAIYRIDGISTETYIHEYHKVAWLLGAPEKAGPGLYSYRYSDGYYAYAESGALGLNAANELYNSLNKDLYPNNSWTVSPAVSPLAIVPYKDICDDQGVCRFIDANPPSNQYVIYMAKLIRNYDTGVVKTSGGLQYYNPDVFLADAIKNVPFGAQHKTATSEVQQSAGGFPGFGIGGLPPATLYTLSNPSGKINAKFLSAKPGEQATFTTVTYNSNDQPTNVNLGSALYFFAIQGTPDPALCAVPITGTPPTPTSAPFSADCSVSPPSAVVNQNVNWSASVSGGTSPYTYSWSGTDGLSSGYSSFNQPYGSEGTKTAQVVVTSADGQTQTASCGNVVIAPALAASCSVSPETAVINQPVTWSASVSGGAGSYVYNWTGTDGLSGSNSSVTTSYSAPGLKTGSVTVSSGGQSATVNCTGGPGGGVQVFSAQLIVAPPSATVDINETLQLNAIYELGSFDSQVVTSSANWSSNNSGIAAVNNSGQKGLVTGVSSVSGGSANITANYTDAFGNALSAASNINVPPAPAVSVTPVPTGGGGGGAGGGAGEYCGSVTLSINVLNAATYDILRNGAQIASNLSPSQTSYTDTSVALHSNYQYQVIAERPTVSTASTPVNVYTNCLPQCSFSAQPASIVKFDDTDLVWNCQYADSCSISQGVGSVSPTSGTKKLFPQNTTTYTLSCSNVDGARNWSATVNVTEPGLIEVPP